MGRKPVRKLYWFECFAEEDGPDWRWRLVSQWNGNIVACSGEGYRRRVDAMKQFRKLGIPVELWEQRDAY
jgi:uncharacterized protein YegP (UPF0339 family)